MNEPQFWNHVNELLDERLDPHEDLEVQRHLTENPAQLAAFERLVSRLEWIARPRTRSHRVPWALAGAAALVLAAWLVHRTVTPAHGPEPLEAQVARFERAPMQVLHYSLTVTRETEAGSIATRLEDGKLSRVLLAPEPMNTRTRLTVVRTTRPDRRLP